MKGKVVLFEWFNASELEREKVFWGAKLLGDSDRVCDTLERERKYWEAVARVMVEREKREGV